MGPDDYMFSLGSATLECKIIDTLFIWRFSSSGAELNIFIGHGLWKGIQRQVKVA